MLHWYNWGYRQHLKEVENADIRPEIAERFARDLARLQYRGIDYRGGRERFIEGIFLEREPYKTSAKRRNQEASPRQPRNSHRSHRAYEA